MVACSQGVSVVRLAHAADDRHDRDLGGGLLDLELLGAAAAMIGRWHPSPPPNPR
jgi:hypothetical protein